MARKRIKPEKGRLLRSQGQSAGKEEADQESSLVSIKKRLYPALCSLACTIMVHTVGFKAMAASRVLTELSNHTLDALMDVPSPPAIPEDKAISGENTTNALMDVPSSIQGDQENTTSSNSEDIVVFYNLYMPSGKNKRAKLIVAEQLEQVGKAFESTSDKVLLYYVSIGQKMNHSAVVEICSRYDNLSCRRQAYHAYGYEERTLQELWNYCNSKPGNQRVVYIHNKGSYHPFVGDLINQDVWRRSGTRAAVSQLCVHPENDKCDFCGLFVTPLPWLHVPGNFWSAKCSYISKLIEPAHHQEVMEDYVENVAKPLIANRSMNMLFQRGQGKRMGPFFGEGRFTAENWIGSHPSAIPCDVAPVSYIDYWRGHVDRDDPFNFSMAPRQDLLYMMDTGEPRIPKYILKKSNLRIRDYHLLGGMITRWLKFYNTVPEPSHWTWEYYPDANIWIEAAAKYGEQAFEVVADTVGPISKKKQNEASAKG